MPVNLQGQIIKDVDVAGNPLYTSPAQPPTSADQVNPTSPVIIPNKEPTVVSPSGATAASAGATTFYDNYQKQLEEQTKQAEAAYKSTQTEVSTQQTSWLQKLMGMQTPSEAKSSAESQVGYPQTEYFASQKARIAELDKMSEEYNNIVARRDAEVARVEGLGGGASIDFVKGQTSEITRKYAPELNRMSAQMNAKAAVMEAERGLFSEAQNYIKDAVTAATADVKYNLDMFTTFYNMNQDKIDRLDTQYKDALDREYQNRKDEYEKTMEEKKLVGELLLNYPNSGISINDSIEDAYRKAGVEAGLDTGVEPVDEYVFSETQKNTGAARAGLSISEFTTLPGDVQNFYISLTAPQQEEIKTLIKEVQSGNTSVQDAVDAINSIQLTPAVKEHLIARVNAVAPQKTAGGGFLSRTWSTWTDWLSRTLYPSSYK